MGKRRSDGKKRYMAILMVLQDGKCFHCGGVLMPCLHRNDGRTSPLEATIEHIVPKASRYRDDWRLAVLAHRKCNVARSDAPLSQTEIARAETIAAEAQYIYTKEL